MTKAKVYVTLKPSVLDPQGKAVMNVLHAISYSDVSDVRVSKYIEITFNHSDKARILRELEQMCDKVLANPNTETYNYEIEEEPLEDDQI